MTREEAIEVLINRYNSGVIRSRTNDDEWRLATDTVIAALRSHDPDTGLLPCGCGGKPRGQEQDHGYYIECDKCHLTTTKDLYLFGNEYKCQDLESARNDWNHGHGYVPGREGAV